MDGMGLGWITQHKSFYLLSLKVSGLFQLEKSFLLNDGKTFPPSQHLLNCHRFPSKCPNIWHHLIFASPLLRCNVHWEIWDAIVFVSWVYFNWSGYIVVVVVPDFQRKLSFPVCNANLVLPCFLFSFLQKLFRIAAISATEDAAIDGVEQVPERKYFHVWSTQIFFGPHKYKYLVHPNIVWFTQILFGSHKYCLVHTNIVWSTQI